MDTTETYIKMSDHPLIQEHRKPTVKRLNDGRDRWEYDFKDGDVFVTHDLFDKEQRIETVGTTIYSPNYYGKSKKPSLDVTKVGYDEGDGYPSKVIIWLPRQGQIQKIVSGSWVIAFEDFNGWYFNKSYPQETYPNDVFISMEQMWLAYYMHKKHGLTWDGDKWEKIEK